MGFFDTISNFIKGTPSGGVGGGGSGGRGGGDLPVNYGGVGGGGSGGRGSSDQQTTTNTSQTTRDNNSSSNSGSNPIYYGGSSGTHTSSASQPMQTTGPEGSINAPANTPNPLQSMSQPYSPTSNILVSQLPQNPVYNDNPVQGNRIDWKATLGGGFTKPGEITAQTYIAKKYNEGANYVSDKVASVLPETKAKHAFFDKNYGFDVTSLAKGAAFAPSMVTGNEALSQAMKAGDIVPQSQTEFVASVKQTGNTATTSYLSKTDMLGQRVTSVGKGISKQADNGEVIGVSRGFNIQPTPKGNIVTEFKSSSTGKELGQVNKVLESTGIKTSRNIENVNPFSSTSYTNEINKYLQSSKNLEQTFTKMPVKEVKPQTTTGILRPINEQRTAFNYVGSTEPQLRIYKSGGMSHVIGEGDFNVQGKIFTSTKMSGSASDVSNGMQSISKTTLKNVGNSVTAMTKQAEKAIVEKVVQPFIKAAKVKPTITTSILPLASAKSEASQQYVTVKPTQSIYYGTGQYEKTNEVTSSMPKASNVSIIGQSQSNNIKVGNIPIVLTGSSSRQRENNRLIPSTAQMPLQNQRPGQREILGVQSRQGQSQAEAQAQTQQQAFRINQPNPTIPNIPKIPIKPNAGYKDNQFIGKSKVKNIFLAQTKRFGKIKTVGVGPTPSKAFAIGQVNVKQTLARSLRVINAKSGQAVKFPIAQGFRPSKSNALWQVQRNAIQSLGEKKEIQAARRGHNLFGI